MSHNAYYNGVFQDISSIRIPLTDRAIFFADGIYDAAIGKNGKIYLEKEHLERFISNAKKLNIQLPISEEELLFILRKMAKNAPMEGFFIYFQLTRSSKARTHSYPDNEIANLLITVTPCIPAPFDHTLKLISAEDLRYAMCNIKTINLLPAVMASKKAEQNGADEAVFHRQNIVTECAHSNIHIIKDGRLITHPLNNYILPGICRKKLIEIAKDSNIEVIERPFSTEDLKNADEVIVTSSSKLALRASEYEDVTYKTSPCGIGYFLCKSFRMDFNQL